MSSFREPGSRVGPTGGAVHKSTIGLLTSLVLGAVPSGYAQQPYLVRDINITLGQGERRPENLVAGSTALFFTAYQTLNGREMHRYTTAEGIDLLLDAVPGPESLDTPVFVAASGGSTFFISGHSLFTSDGTNAGTRLVRTFPGPNPYPSDPVAVPGGVFFNIQTPTTVDLWWSDGSDAGTHLVVANIDSYGTRAASGGRLFFTHYDAGGGELWTSDGSLAGTRRVKDICPGPCSGRGSLQSLADVDGTLYFVADDGTTGRALWRTDGTEAGTTFVVDVTPSSNGGLGSLAAFGSRVLFDAASGSVNQLWISDGTLGGTVLLAEGEGFGPAHDADGIAFFVGHDAATGGELWKTDGTPAGTGRVTDGCPGPCDFLEDDTRFGSVPGVVLFRRTPKEMWRSDGTPTGTFLLSEFDYDGHPEPIVRLAGRAYFAAARDDSRDELWTTDGTVAGTSIVDDVLGSGSTPQMIGAVSERVFFTAFRPDVGNEIWSSTGDAASTTVIDLNPGAEGVYVGESAALADRLVVTVSQASTHLWSTDGSPAGTQALTTGFAQNVRASNGRAFFAKGFGSNEREPWWTDGTPAGTREIADLEPGASGSDPRGFVSFRGETYFTATVGFLQSLWRTDGTLAGTARVGTRPCFPRVVASARLFLDCVDATTGLEPWVTDGTEAGTRPLGDLTPGNQATFIPLEVEVDGTVYFVADVPGLGWELWRSDGTAGGTAPVIDLVPGPSGSGPSGLTAIGGTLYFVAHTPSAGRELWRTDGTIAGTAMVRDINAGPGDGVMDIARVGTRLVLAAYTPATGVEPWTSDGTAAGTVALSEIAPGPSSALYGNLRTAGRTVYMPADDGVHGLEPWAITMPDTGVARVGDVVVHEGDGGSATARFEVTLESPAAAAVEIAYATAAGTAQPGTDFTTVAGTLTFPPGATGLGVDVPVAGDLGDEPDETFSLVLTPLGGAVASDARGTAVILDDDGPTIATADTSVAEGNAGTTPAVLQVTITTGDGTPTPTEKSIVYETRGITALAGSDFQASSGALTFAAGTPSGTVGTVTVNVIGDSIDEPDEAFAVRLTARGDERLPDPDAVARILDDDGLAGGSPQELLHGSVVRTSLAPAAGGQDRDYYVLSAQPFASYELVVDETSGDAVPLTVERVTSGGTIAQSAVPVGVGGALSLRWRTSGTSVVTGEHLRVESAACGSSCGADDTYRLRFYETTLRATRFNNNNDQASVLILQNRSASPVGGTVFLWQTTGAPLTPSEEFTIGPHGTFVFNLAGAFPGWSGSLTVAHDAPYGMLVGKTVALEPSTGFSFDTPLTPRPR